MIFDEIPGLSALCEDADAFLIDQFGTIHDGEHPYPGAIDTLRAIRHAGKRIILLSNSGRRAPNNNARLEAMGITPDCYDASLCSGEVGWAALHEDPLPCLQRHCRVLLLARDPALDILEGFDIEPVDTVAQADLIMLAGSQTDRFGYDALWARIHPGIARGVPLVCTNPDRLMLAGGALHPGAGTLAEAYREAGGQVRWYGKPHPKLYRAAFALLPGVSRVRMFGVGDSIEHDIAGAAARGCASVLVRTGIIASADDAAVEAEMVRWSCRPSAVAARFIW
jgi:HAD superfamily hydrolase (TIGR01459 family)